MTDGQTHALELYFLDWDNGGRSESVTLSDAATGTVLATETVSSFHSGVYLDWSVSGNILITITKLSGYNAVLSGLFFDTPGTSATFIKLDTATEGTWIGTYGAVGYDVINSTANLPSYAKVTPSGQTSYTWAATTTDPRALQTAGGSSRIASCWFTNTSFTVDVNLSDGQTHALELYFLDWDNLYRNETVTLSNAVTGTVLATATVSSFGSGVYVDWVVSGNILITITNNRPSATNAVLSGLFIDRPMVPPPTSTAAFIKRDTATEGRWIGTYGAAGYDVINSTASLPSYATVTPSGQSSYTWAATTTDPRALQTAGGSSRIAACWFANTSFTVDVNLSDGQAHVLELYFLDWENESRSESVTLSDADTGTVLDTETVSSFRSGVYLDWSVSGNILITITNNKPSSTNAVLSGVFIDPPSVPTTASATFVKRDTATEGTWMGTYGAAGYDVINSTANIPSYATVTPSGQTSYTWAATTTDPRALPDRRWLQPHRVLLVREHELHGGCQHDRWTDARTGALFPRLGQRRSERERDLERRRHGDGVGHRDGLVVSLRRLPRLVGERQHFDHDHEAVRVQRRAQRTILRPGDRFGSCTRKRNGSDRRCKWDVWNRRDRGCRGSGRGEQRKSGLGEQRQSGPRGHPPCQT